MWSRTTSPKASDLSSTSTWCPSRRRRPSEIAGADLLVVGGPTHVHSMSSEKSRKAAKDSLSKPGSDLRLDPDAETKGLRDWFHELAPVENTGAAAFDTRIDASPLLTGRASRRDREATHQARLRPRRRSGELPRRQDEPSAPGRSRARGRVGRGARREPRREPVTDVRPSRAARHIGTKVPSLTDSRP